jgi:hypothetical protein
MDTLKKHLSISGSERLVELSKIAQRFEDRIFSAATSQVHTLTLRIIYGASIITYGYSVLLFFHFSLIIFGKYL